MLSNKILKDGMTKTKENWDYIGKVLAACLNAELIPAYILLSVRIVLLHTSIRFIYQYRKISFDMDECEL